MRMWMVDPKILCKNHLLGEHRELHLLCGALRHKHSIDGYLIGGLLDPRYLRSRHQDLVTEMSRRGYSDFTPMQVPDFSYLNLDHEPCYVNSQHALRDLLSRCDNCRKRYQDLCEEVKTDG